MFEACGMDEDINGTVIYTPNSTSLKSVALEIYVDGLLHQILGCRGSFQIVLVTGETGKVQFTFTGKYRFYTQDQADFYSDLFPRSEATNFRARDKELSQYVSQTFRLQASYELFSDWSFIEKGSVNFVYDELEIDYDNFSDLSTGALIGQEPLYVLEAGVYQLFFSFWF